MLEKHAIYCVVHVFLKYAEENVMIADYTYLEIFNFNFVIYTVYCQDFVMPVGPYSIF